MLAELLKKWVELEPGNCLKGGDEGDGNEQRFQIELIENTWDYIDLQSLTPYDFAALQFAVQSAIAERHLRCRIENSENGWFVTLTNSATPKLEFFPTHHDKECAVALLKAYISYLEGQKAAAPT